MHAAVFLGRRKRGLGLEIKVILSARFSASFNDHLSLSKRRCEIASGDPVFIGQEALRRHGFIDRVDRW